jgi:hypothetical protein
MLSTKCENAKFETRKLVLIIIAVVLALVVVAFFFRPQTTRSPVEGEPELQAPQSANSTPQVVPVTGAESADVEIPGVNKQLSGVRETAGTAQRGQARFDEPEIVPRDVAINNYKADLWAEIQASPPEPRDLDDPAVDADLAYRLYTYYGNCSVIPRTQQQVDGRLEGISKGVEHAMGGRLQDMEGRVDQIMSNYELCGLIPPEVDCRLEAVHWLTKAVKLGHDIAEVQFYEKAMGFILRPDRLTNDPPLAMQQPGLVYAFKDTARFGLARALEKGRPEAYLANSQALLEGMIYPKNPLEAFVYARAAELTAARYHLILQDLDYWKKAAAQHLTEEQLKEAENMALDLQSLNHD